MAATTEPTWFTFMIIWGVRVLLPALFFWLFLYKGKKKAQAGSGSANARKEDEPKVQGAKYRRSLLLACKQWSADQPQGQAPAEMRTLKTLGTEEAPQLFSNRERNRASRERGEREGRAERSERRSRRDEKEKMREAAKKQAAPGSPDRVLDNIRAEKAKREERLQLESLVNYMAFNPPGEKTSFLPEGGEARGETTTASHKAPAPKPTKEGSERAMEEALIVLQGAMRHKRVDVARSLFDQLAEAQCTISDETYTTAVELCVECGEMKEASEFLRKMEAAGHIPGGKLLDKVMNMVTQQKADEQAGWPARAGHRAGGPPRAGGAWLSPAAEVFVPGQARSPGGLSPGATAFVTGGGLSPGAPAFVPEAAISSPLKALSKDAPEFVPAWAVEAGVPERESVINTSYSSDEEDEEDPPAGELRKRK